LQGGAPVTLRLRGRDMKGMAVPRPGDQELRQRMLKKLYPTMAPERAAELVAETTGLSPFLTNTPQYAYHK
jgi:hypothetical protein